MARSKRLARLSLLTIACGVIAGAFSTGMTAAGAGMKPVTPNVHGSVFLIHANSDKNFCIETNDGTATPSVYMAFCGAGDAQRWNFSNGADGLNVIFDAQGTCLEVGNGPNKSLTLGVAPCTYRKHQKFSVQPNGMITEGHTKQCLAISHPAQNAQVFLEACDETSGTQIWALGH